MVQLRIHKAPRLTGSTPLDSGDSLYVHLCSGEVLTVSPATAVHVNDVTIDVLNHDEVVASFARNDVYFAADEVMEPPSLG